MDRRYSTASPPASPRLGSTLFLILLGISAGFLAGCAYFQIDLPLLVARLVARGW